MRQHDLDSKGVLSLGEPCWSWGFPFAARRETPWDFLFSGPQLIGTFPQRQSGTATSDGLSCTIDWGPLWHPAYEHSFCFRFLRTPLINWWWVIIPDQGYHPSLLTKPCKKNCILRGSLSKFNMEFKKLWKMIFRRNWSSTWVPCEILDLCSFNKKPKKSRESMLVLFVEPITVDCVPSFPHGFQYLNIGYPIPSHAWEKHVPILLSTKDRGGIPALLTFFVRGSDKLKLRIITNAQ